MSKRYICVREDYKNANGEDKATFLRVGEIFTGKNGKDYAKLYHIPKTVLYVFDEKKNDNTGSVDLPVGEDTTAPF